MTVRPKRNKENCQQRVDRRLEPACGGGKLLRIREEAEIMYGAINKDGTTPCGPACNVTRQSQLPLGRETTPCPDRPPACPRQSDRHPLERCAAPLRWNDCRVGWVTWSVPPSSGGTRRNAYQEKNLSLRSSGSSTRSKKGMTLGSLGSLPSSKLYLARAGSACQFGPQCTHFNVASRTRPRTAARISRQCCASRRSCSVDST